MPPKPSVIVTARPPRPRKLSPLGTANVRDVGSDTAAQTAAIRIVTARKPSRKPWALLTGEQPPAVIDGPDQPQRGAVPRQTPRQARAALIVVAIIALLIGLECVTWELAA